MRQAALTPTRLRTALTRLSLCLLILGGWIVDAFAETPFDRWVRQSAARELRKAAWFLRKVILLLAAHEYTPMPRLRAGIIPANAPPGVRSRVLRGNRRFMRIRGMHEGDVTTRTQRLRRLIKQIDTWIARLTARLYAQRRAPVITLTSPSADAITGAACAAPVWSSFNSS